MHLAPDKGIIFKGRIVLVTEELGEEKMPVLVIVQGSEFKFIQSAASLGNYRVVLGALFRKDSGNGSLSKL